MPKDKHGKQKGFCRVCGKPVHGAGRLYCKECVPPVEQNGYILVYAPDHLRADAGGYVREHIMVAEQILGRLLEPGEVVHHEDKDGYNNDPGNLRIFPSASAHSKYHQALRRKALAQDLRQVSREELLQCWYVIEGTADKSVEGLMRHSGKVRNHIARIVGTLHVALVYEHYWKHRGRTLSDYAREHEETFLLVVDRYISKIEAGQSVADYGTASKLLREVTR